MLYALWNRHWRSQELKEGGHKIPQNFSLLSLNSTQTSLEPRQAIFILGWESWNNWDTNQEQSWLVLGLWYIENEYSTMKQSWAWLLSKSWLIGPLPLYLHDGLAQHFVKRTGFKKNEKWKLLQYGNWTRQESNTQTSVLESDTLPLCPGSTLILPSQIN